MYCYLAARVNGKPRRVYLGTAAVARLHHLLTLLDREKRAQRKQAKVKRTATIAGFQRETTALVDGVRQLVRAARLLRGQYQHAGQWRRRRARLGIDLAADPEVVLAEACEGGTDNPVDRLRALNDQANAKDRVALAVLARLLAPGSRLWAGLADRAVEAAVGWSDVLARPGRTDRAEAERLLGVWRAQLVGERANPLVNAAADAAAVVALAYQLAEREAKATRTRKAAKRLAVAGRRCRTAGGLIAMAVAAGVATPLTRRPEGVPTAAPEWSRGAG